MFNHCNLIGGYIVVFCLLYNSTYTSPYNVYTWWYDSIIMPFYSVRTVIAHVIVPIHVHVRKGELRIHVCCALYNTIDGLRA